MANIFTTKFFEEKQNIWMFKREKYEKLISNSTKSINNIPILFIKEILKNKKLYNYVYNCFSTKNINIEFISIDKNIEDTPIIIEYEKKHFIEALEIFLRTEKFSNNKKNNINKLIKTKEYTFFKENLLNQEVIPNIKYNDVIDLLLKDKEELDEILKSETIFGITKNKLIEVLLKPPFNFLGTSPFYESFNFEQTLAQKLQRNFKYIKYLYSIDEIAVLPFQAGNFDINQVNINPKLANDLLNEIPKEYNNLQKIYYIYRRLCQKFSYDEEYFAGLQKKMYSINHQNINRLEEISDDNNIVVCYEIVMILAKFCHILNIPFIILNKGDEEFRHYGSGHTKLKLKIDDFVITADPADGIIHSDMFYEKIYNKVEKFKLHNSNQRTVDQFTKHTKLVDEYLDKNKKTFIFEDTKDLYYFNSNHSKTNITPNERLELFISIIKKNKTNMMDTLGYFLDIRKNIFNKELDKLCKCVYVCNTNTIDNQKEISVSFVIIYNEFCDVELNPNQNQYILIDSNKNFTTITFQELKELFDNKILKYINFKHHNMIPGITITKEEPTQKIKDGDEMYEQGNNFTEHRRKA